MSQVEDDVYAWLDDHYDQVREGGEYVGRIRGAEIIKNKSGLQWAERSIGDAYLAWRGESQTTQTVDEPETSDDESVWRNDYLDRPNVHYNQEDDVYVVFLESRARAMPIDGDDFRTLRQAYSNWDGEESTINEICREFAIVRQDFIDLKQSAGWTHDSAPFTDEEFHNRSHDELVDDLIRQQERAVYRKWKKKEWKQTEDDASKWREFKRETIEPMLEGVDEAPKIENPELSEPNSQLAGMLFETDRHLDGRSKGGAGIDTHRQRWLETVDQSLGRMTQFGQPEKIYLVLGSDQFNVDTHENTTTNGTPQAQSVGQAKGIFEVAQAGCEVIEKCRSVAPTIVRVIPGNHDRRTAKVYLWGLKQRYRNSDTVEVRGKGQPYQYERYGSNVLAWHHGDGIGGGDTGKEQNLTSKMISDVPELVGECSHRHWFVGHKHKMWSDEGATHVEMAPTPKPQDEWEDFKGFPEGQTDGAAWLFDRDGGQVARFLASLS